MGAPGHGTIGPLDIRRTTMTAAEKLAIHELLSRAAYGLDERDLGVLEQCFAADAKMLVRIAASETIGPFEGRQAILKLMTDTIAARSDTRRHVISNIFFESEADAAATVISNVTLFSVDHGQISTITSGIYRDVVVKENGDWKFSERHLNLDLPF